MNRKNLLTLCFACLISLSACGSNSSDNSTLNSSSNVEIITGVEIVGPTSVLVGKTINLTVDVIGSSDDSVTWTSSDNNIATVDSDGILKGIREGSVDITATSIKSPNFSKTITINVTLPKINDTNFFIEDSENVIYDETLDKYTVNLGKPFYINTSFIPNEGCKTPSVSYSFLYEDGSDYNSAVSVEIIPETTRAKVISFASLTGVIVKSTAKYDDMTGNDIIKSIVIDVVDNNKEEHNSILNTINSFEANEKSSLVSSKITRTKVVSNGNNTNKEVTNITNNSFTNASYTTKNTKNYLNNTLNKETNDYYYQGKQMINSIEHLYEFKYDKDGNIIEFYNNIDSSNSMFNDTNTFENYTRNLGLIMDVHNSVTYGYYNILLNILNSSYNLYDGDLLSFGNDVIYAYCEYEITNNYFKIISNYLDEDYNTSHSLSLEVNYDNNKLLSYKFIEEINNNNTSITFTEEANEFVYGTKNIDSIENPNYLDLSKYFINEFELISFNEKDPLDRYDYSNKDKYGADVETIENNLPKYIASYDKSIVLKVNALNPSTANVNFDTVKAQSSDTNQIPNVESLHDGIFVINAKKDPKTAKHYAGKATFTFTTTLGVQKQVIIEFVETTLKSVFVNFGNETPKLENNVYVYNSIFVNEMSSYFYINTDPDESKYEFAINIIEGNKDGISLYKYEDNNPYGYPGFSFAVKGIKVGTYKFNIYVIGHDYIKSEKTFEITVEEPYSTNYIEENIIGKNYVYDWSTSRSLFTFVDSTTLKYTYEAYDSSLSQNFKYHIESGAIIVDSIQNFNSGMYFSKINEGKIIFSKDFKQMKFHLELSSDAIENGYKFAYYTFNYLPDPISIDNIESYLNGKTLVNDENNAYVTFNNGKGTFELFDYDGNKYVTFTFDYAYNQESKLLVFSNSTSSNSSYYLGDNRCEFDVYNQQIVIRVYTVGEYEDWYNNYIFKLI